MDHARTPEPAERRPGPASAATTAPAATVDFQPDAMVGPRGPAFGRLGPTALLGLQRTVGNAATGALLRREAGRERPAVVQREGGGPAPSPSVKHTFTFPDKKLGERELSYVTATTSVGGSLDYEVTPAPAPAAAAPAASPSPVAGAPAASDAGGPTPLPSPGSGELKGSGGVNASATDLKYQAEVGVEFEKRAVGLFEGCAPKAKIGGEASGDKGKLGIELSMEGNTFEPKFAFNLAEMDPQKGIHFATLEAAVDWKIREWSFTAQDGSAIKITPKATLKVAIEPNYERIFQYLLEEGGAEVAADALIAGGMIAAGAIAIIGFLATLGDGEAEARAVDNAEKARTQLVAGFVAGATGEELALKDDFTMKGHNRGLQWRTDLQNGQRGKGIPVPPSVIDAKSKEHRAQIEAGAVKTANQLMHEALVQRYWEIHWAQRYVPWAEIDTTFMMLMEGQQFGRPQLQEGKNAAGVSVLPE
jgi:hypothetical protein